MLVEQEWKVFVPFLSPIKEIMTMIIHPNLMEDETTSTSPKNLTAQTLMRMITTQKMVIQAAVGTLSVQKLRTVTTPYGGQVLGIRESPMVNLLVTRWQW